MTARDPGAPGARCPQCGTANRDGARFCGACGAAAASTEPAPSPSPGAGPTLIGREIAGRYRILAKLGEGGMGAVFRAEQISLKRTVAVKLLRPEVVADPMLLRRFNAEAEVVAKLSHPNTVNIYDFGQDGDGTLFIAMELIDGRSLRSVIQHEAPLPPGRTLAIAAQVAASLTDAHARAIVHRDLKPDNVMLQDRGRERDVVRVLDFGIAKLRDDNRATQMQMTQQGDMLGTPQYMSPEQIRAQPIDGRTDIYALGCLIYEMVTGRLPHDAATVLAMLSKHLLEAPVPPSQRRPDLGLSPALDALVLGAMAKDPAARPPTMEAFGEQIAALRQRLPADPRAAPHPTAGAPSHPDPLAATPYPGAPVTPAAQSLQRPVMTPHNLPGAPVAVAAAAYTPAQVAPSPYGALPQVTPSPSAPPGAPHAPHAMPPYGALPQVTPSPSAPPGTPHAMPPYGAPPFAAPPYSAPPPGTPPHGAAHAPPVAQHGPQVAQHGPPFGASPPRRSRFSLAAMIAISAAVVAGAAIIGVVATRSSATAARDAAVDDDSDKGSASQKPPARDPWAPQPSEDKPPARDPWAPQPSETSDSDSDSEESDSPPAVVPRPSRSPRPPRGSTAHAHDLPDGQKMALGQGVSLIVPPGFQIGSQDGLTVAFDARGVVIAGGPITYASDNIDELIKFHARTNQLVFETKAAIPIGGAKRPIAVFRGTFNGVPVHHVAVALIGRGYRTFVIFQVPIRIENDAAIGRLATEVFARRILLP